MKKDQTVTVYVSNTFPFECCLSGQKGPKPHFYKQALPFGGLDCYEFSDIADAKGFRSEVELLPSSNHDAFFDLARKFNVCFTPDGVASKKSEPQALEPSSSFTDLTGQLSTLQVKPKEPVQKHDLNDYREQIKSLAYTVCASFQATKDRSFLKLCEKLLDVAE